MWYLAICSQFRFLIQFSERKFPLDIERFRGARLRWIRLFSISMSMWMLLFLSYASGMHAALMSTVSFQNRCPPDFHQLLGPFEKPHAFLCSDTCAKWVNIPTYTLDHDTRALSFSLAGFFCTSFKSRGLKLKVVLSIIIFVFLYLKSHIWHKTLELVSLGLV